MSQFARSRPTFYRIFALLAATGIVAAALSLVPAVFATHLGTSGADVIVDLRQPVQTVSIPTVGSFSSISVPTTPANGRLVHSTATELTLVGISTTGPGTGYGYTGGATSVELYNTTSGSVLTSTPLSTGPDGPGGALRNATFLLSANTIPGPGVYGVRGAGTTNTVAFLLFWPRDDISVGISPASLAYSGSTTVFTINTTSGGSGLLSGLTDGGIEFIPSPAQTASDGTFTFASSIPQGAGLWPIWAYRNDSGPQTGPSGASIPERLSNTSLLVTTQALSVSVIASTATAAGSQTIVHRPSYPSGNAVFRVAGGQFPSDANIARFNLTIRTPHSLEIHYNQTMLAASAGVVQLSPSGCWNSTSGSSGCGSAAPLLNVDRDTGDVRVSPGDDAYGTNTWSPGLYTIQLTLEAAGGAQSLPEFQGSWQVNVAVPPPAGGVPTLSIGNVSGGPLLPVNTSIRLHNMSNLGSMTLNLTFDPSIVRVEGISLGNVTGGQVTWNVNNTTGVVQLLLTTGEIPGPAGNFTLVNVSLRAVGSVGAVSPLTVVMRESVHANGSAFALAVVPGSFRSGLLGDVTGDGLIDAFDASALSEYVVGLRTAAQIQIANADATRDGAVTGADAMFIRQFVGGARPSL